LRVCRRACQDLAPILYRTCCVSFVYPGQVIRRLGTIGARNNSYIRYLVIRFTSLLLKYDEERYVEETYVKEITSDWDSALEALPKILSLTFDFERDPKDSMIWSTLDDNMLLNDPVVGNELAISATAWAKKIQPSLTIKAENWEYQYWVSALWLMPWWQWIKPYHRSYYSTLRNYSSSPPRLH